MEFCVVLIQPEFNVNWLAFYMKPVMRSLEIRIRASILVMFCWNIKRGAGLYKVDGLRQCVRSIGYLITIGQCVGLLEYISDVGLLSYFHK